MARHELVAVRQRRRDAAAAPARSRPCRGAGSPTPPGGPALATVASARRAPTASPRSQPSLNTTTTAPRAIPRAPQRSRKALSVSPETGAARPVRHLLAGADQRPLGVAVRSGSVTRVSRVPRVNTSTRPWRRAVLDQVREPQQRVGVGPHRGGHVDEQHRAPHGRPAPAVLHPAGLAHLAQRRPQRAVDVDLTPAPGRTPGGPPPRRPGTQRARSSRRAAPSRPAGARPRRGGAAPRRSLAAACTTSGTGLAARLARLTQRQRGADLRGASRAAPCAAGCSRAPNHASKTWP